MTPSDLPVTYLDGAALTGGGAVVISAVWGLKDTIDRTTRILHVADDVVSYIDVPENIISVVQVPDGTGTVIGLAKSGVVLPVFPELGTPEPMGRSGASKLISLHANADEQFACGLNGQIYRRTHGHWQPFDDGLYTPKVSSISPHLRGIAGRSRDEMLVTVGLFGMIAEFGGGEWTKVEIPTNCSFENLVEVRRGEFLVCGDRGLLAVGSSGSWSIADTGTNVTFWDVDKFQGKLFLSSFDGIFEYNTKRESIQQVDFDMGFMPGTYKLSASTTELWSFGQDSILCFDGRNWRRLKIPSNG
ncbi:hypothetical protein [Mesorhizobium sp. WSM2239]|uniref:Uncharacterized protein n=2 Tax=unclassified Mesorhizobium TaxID=325217 RepID=A0AAU8DHF7_9HYPH